MALVKEKIARTKNLRAAALVLKNVLEDSAKRPRKTSTAKVITADIKQIFKIKDAGRLASVAKAAKALTKLVRSGPVKMVVRAKPKKTRK